MGRGRMGPSGGSSRGGMGSSGGSIGRSSSIGRSHRGTTILVGGSYRHGGRYHGSGSPWVGVIVGAIFLITGFFIVIGGFVSLFSSSNYLPIEARYVDCDEGRGGWYYRTYTYTIDGTDYTNRSMQSWEFADLNDIGKVFEIYYLESDPNKIYEEIPEENDVSENVVIIFSGLVCGGIGALALVLCLKDIKKKKETNNSGSTTNKEVIKEQTDTKCPYCGSRYNKNSNNCPKCGAGRDI